MLYFVNTEFITEYQNNCRLLILASDQTYLICLERVPGETNDLSHNVKLRLFYHKMTTMAYVTMTHSDLLAVAASENL